MKNPAALPGVQVEFVIKKYKLADTDKMIGSCWTECHETLDGTQFDGKGNIKFRTHNT